MFSKYYKQIIQIPLAGGKKFHLQGYSKRNGALSYQSCGKKTFVEWKKLQNQAENQFKTSAGSTNK
jgi:hypothetical protein